LILKVATVIGDNFDLNTLSKIHPFQQSINLHKLVRMLEELEAKGIIEIMDQQEDNIYYRFVFPFFRESLYQRMTFKQRR
jgi:adenylate cyclase 10